MIAVLAKVHYVRAVGARFAACSVRIHGAHKGTRDRESLTCPACIAGLGGGVYGSPKLRVIKGGSR